MNDVRLFTIKLVTSALIFAVSLDLFFDASFSDIVTFAALTTVISYFIGDKIILPRLGSRQAALVDFFTVYMIVWIFGNVLLHSYEQLAWGSITAAFLTGIAELIVHRFMNTENSIERQTASQQQQQQRLMPKLAFGTEFAEEQEPLRPQKKEEE